MKKSNKSLSIDELTKNEISAVETNDKIGKLEKENFRQGKLIAEYKEREKLSARALVLYERKIKWLKQTIIDDVLEIAKGIDANKKEFLQKAGQGSNEEIKSDLEKLADELGGFEDKLYEICNVLEANAIITKSDREFISNKTKTRSSEGLGSKERFDRLKQEFEQKIGSSVMRKPGRPKKSEQSIVAEIGLRKKPEAKIDQDNEVEGKINDLFYKAPTKTTVVSTIPQTDDSIFDFNEALNPNISLKDIMADLMSEKDDSQERPHYSSEEASQMQEDRKSKIDLLESGYLSNRSYERVKASEKEDAGASGKPSAKEDDGVAAKANEKEKAKIEKAEESKGKNGKATFEGRFFSLNDIVRDL